MLGKKFTAPWLYSTWGSDLDYYLKQSKENLQDISKILPSVDYLITECQRDERLAYTYGFKGACLGHFPAFGGISLEEYANLNNRENRHFAGPFSSKAAIIPGEEILLAAQ